MRFLAFLLSVYAGAVFAQPTQPQEPQPTKPAPSAAAPSAAAPSAATGATAATGRTPSLFSQLDRNRDGYLDKNELESELARRGNWMAVDRDGDGRISPSEFRALEPR